MTETKIARGAPLGLWAFLRAGRPDTAVGIDPTQRSGVSAALRGWNPKRLLALTLMLVLSLAGIAGVFSSSSASAKEDDVMKYSFYKIASSTTAFFSTVQEPGSDKSFSEPWAQVIADPGSAGSLLGYADPNFSSVSGWLASKLSGSSDAIGYETLLVRESDDDTTGYSGSKFQGMVDYAYFGAALKGMGLDGTSTGLSLGFMNTAAGGLIMVLYILGGAVDFVFNAFLSLLSLLNPFKLFYQGVSAINPEFADGMVGGGNADVGPLSGLASWIGGWYQALSALSWQVMVPIFIGVLLFSLFMFKKMDRGGAFKKILVRIVFIGLGLPLLGSMYTGMLTSVTDGGSDGNAGSTRVVMSTYVDFENWATNSRLAIPAGAKIEWDTARAQPSGAAQANVRNTALAINNQTHGLGLKAIVSSGAYDATWSNQILEGKASDASTRTQTYGTTVDMLARFMSNAQVSAASFETTAKGDLTQSAFYATNADGAVKDWFESLEKDSKALNSADATPGGNPLISVTAGQGLRGNSITGGRAFTSSTTGCLYTGTAIALSQGSPRACNLSPLAMFNYLNTDFGSTSMTMYSSSNVQSEATRSIHNSVNQVGTGTMSFLYWFNAVVLLGSFVVIGLGYAFALLFSSIRRSFQVVTAVPFATLGALPAIAKVVVYSVALILEVLITIFVYKMVQEFLTSLPQLIEMPFSWALNDGAAGPMATFVVFLTSGWAFPLVVTLLSIIGVIVFTVTAMRLRKMFVKAVEETVTKLVEKFMDTQVGIPGGGGKMVPALAGGLAAGAGAAAANRMMSGGSKGASVDATPKPGAGGGPDGIQTAGGLTPTGPGPDGDGGQLEIDGGGQLEITGGAEGNGDPGSSDGPRALESGTSTSVADEVALGRAVDANGLSKQGETRAPQVEGDAMSVASDSMEQSAAGYQAADAKRLAAGTEGAKAAGHAGVAVGKGFAGDATGAAESGGRAVEHGGAAVSKGHEAKQAEQDAGRSSLDKPNQKHARKAAQAQQVSRVGGTVANAAGAARGTSGTTAVPGSAGTSSPQVNTPSAPATPRPAQRAPQAPRSTPAAPTRASQAPRTVRAPRPQPTGSGSATTVPAAPRPVRPPSTPPRRPQRPSPRDE
ncbi:hypothetical protein SAMN06295974_3700 [Plantibacter flavus]|uniref:TrbL/VirB6 plasmid conjugal transfer protein n=1 Tax=Plantibacter flavus TaxID=150123 RepID=A0A3N2BL19_9MICO|nr:hypothetical protein [Plantibacter flavus]ROR75965.1 hypothetical protein EDD42_3916 [Plantibacter flavus]SMG48237.1 hypothetical protein SAMN06295974_3700 [Plantibacter flavus]